MVWDDTGTGGKRGSFWSVNLLGLLVATEGHESPHPATAGGAAAAGKGVGHSFADLPSDQFTAANGFTDKAWVSAVAALKKHDLSHSHGMLGAEEAVLTSNTSNGITSAGTSDRLVIPQTKDGWLEIEVARGKWRRIRFNLDSNGKITCWHDKPDDRVPFPPGFSVRELKNARAGKHAFRLEFSKPVSIEAQIFPSHRKVSKIALAAPSDEEKEIWMHVLGMAGHMLPENYVNAKSSAVIRAEDAARDRRTAAEITPSSPASRANGLAIVEKLNSLASQGDASKTTAKDAPSSGKQAMPSGGLATRGSLPSAGPGSSQQSAPPNKQLPARPTQSVLGGSSKSDSTSENKVHLGRSKADPSQAVLPPGWTAHLDPGSNLHYYYHAASGTSSWEMPKEGAEKSSSAELFEDCKEPEKAAAAQADVGSQAVLPPGWTAHLDPDSNLYYYYHAASGSSSWEMPKEGAEKGS
jgi:hypothetical protein